MFLLQLNYQITWGFIDTCQHFFFLLVNIILLAYKETKYLKTPKKMKKRTISFTKRWSKYKNKMQQKEETYKSKRNIPHTVNHKQKLAQWQDFKTKRKEKKRFPSIAITNYGTKKPTTST